MPETLPDLHHVRSGKVRDIYDVGDHLLLVASDRVSTYDCVHPTPIPDKGRVLTGISVYWFDRTADLVPNHLVTADVAAMPDEVQRHADQLRGRSMLVRPADVIPFECVARGYLSGSALAEYRATGEVAGLPLPDGLREASELPAPIFTPATKAESGHDENVTFERLTDELGEDLATTLRRLTLELYRFGRELARRRGIILADTKYEFGLIDGQVTLVDEVMTPDSSRYWPADRWEPGTTPPSFDKQFVRDFATSTGWDKTPPAPEIPDDVVARTREKYVEAYERITERRFAEWLGA